jgi:hypothetical protein
MVWLPFKIWRLLGILSENLWIIEKMGIAFVEVSRISIAKREEFGLVQESTRTSCVTLTCKYYDGFNIK